ncbi:MAG: DNA polymerase III subunit chi [Hyphomicrobiales bacterium]|nr:DNA polymerase III subunit chi [Hyphomicrobiales bacterium]
MTEVMFYHLERQRLEDALPLLLEKTLERGWRAVVQAGSRERVEALDAALWTYAEDSFLPHGAGRDNAARQPIYLTAGDDNPNGATVRFLVDGAAAPDLGPYHRVVFMFDGRDDDAVAAAREEWRRAKAAGAAVTYWRQTEAGRWEKKA